MGAEFVRTSAKRTHFTAHFVADRQIRPLLAPVDLTMRACPQQDKITAAMRVSTARSAPNC